MRLTAPPGLCYQFPVMRNLQAFHIEPDLVVRELPNGAVEIQRGVLVDATEVSRDQLADAIVALRAVSGVGVPPGVDAWAQADLIIQCLNEYGGFDSWWDSVEHPDRTAIRTAITNILTR